MVSQVADSGFHLLLASEDAGGYGQGWTAAYPLLRGLGYWQVPLPLAETLVAAQLASAAAVPAGKPRTVAAAHGLLQVGAVSHHRHLGNDMQRVGRSQEAIQCVLP